ncbi:MAG: GIY-YIG nuclease family protein [Desulfotomaculaceae bacterium]|nr:GIY-YIG nuclease family protein [Desulfotomaculaceae bacterium]MDD4767170.1 GIY-YIG nuclease family protein [Desulfotomaculaceae bacterium]
MDRKKELKMQYKLMKPEMGIFIIRSKVNNKCFLKATPNLRGVINGTRVRLGSGFHPCRELQKEWDEFGPEKFSIEILERLAYDKDEAKSDYSEELEILQMLWKDKLAQENLEFYKKRI